MGKRKLKVNSWGIGVARDNHLTLYFTRPLSKLEAEGIVHLVKEGLARDGD